MMARRFFGYSLKCSWYQRWLENARGTRFVAVNQANTQAGTVQAASANPIHSTISPKVVGAREPAVEAHPGGSCIRFRPAFGG